MPKPTARANEISELKQQLAALTLESNTLLREVERQRNEALNALAVSQAELARLKKD